MSGGADFGERRLWLVRHGETEGQSSIRFHGSGDVRLSDEGRAQIVALAAWLQGVPFARIVHSPLVRAAESASILARECGLAEHLLCSDERWREISFGHCEGLTRDEINAAFPDFWRAHLAGVAVDFPGGERRADFTARVAAAARELVNEPWQGDLLVVAHRGSVRQALRALLGVPASVPDPFGVELGSLTILREERGWHLDLIGALP